MKPPRHLLDSPNLSDMDAGKAPLLVPQQSPQPILEPTLSASRRWATLGCSVLVMGVSGTVYSYGSIEVALKADLGLNDAVGSTLGLLCNFGACVCPHPPEEGE